MTPLRLLAPVSLVLLLSFALVACTDPPGAGPVLGVTPADAVDDAALHDAADAGPLPEDATPALDATADAEDGQTDAAQDDALAGTDVEDDGAGTDAETPDIEPVDAGPDVEPGDTAEDVAPVEDIAPIEDIAPDTVADTTVADAAPADTPVDTAVDTAVDAADAGPTPPPPTSPCDTDEDCLGTGTGKKCDLGTHTCVACLKSADCNAGELCQAQTCLPSKTCKSDTDCKATNQVCDKAESVCVDCVTATDCSGAACVDHACVTQKACKSSKDCPFVCDAAQGICVQCTTSLDCADGQYCVNGGCKADLCAGPVCAGGKAFACKPDGGGYLVGKSCDDGNVCTEGDACDAGACKPGPAKACDDANPCTSDSCDAVLGCLFVNNTVACDDGDPCTGTDVCGGGKCAGAPKICDDGNVCTSDACQAGACVHPAQPGACTDGTVCTDGDLCDAGACKPGKAVPCDDGKACTTDACDPVKGCTYTNKTGPCDDGNNCTQDDACQAGACVGVGKQCDDGNPCTDDKCDAGVCSFVANTKPCTDGNVCTDGDVCAAGKCAGKAKVCNDGNPCTDDSCGAAGCVFAANAAGCSDGDGCTDSDVCAAGKCAGKLKNCDDGNPCTSDSCNCVGGAPGGATCTCTYAPLAGPCGEPGSCAACSNGKCVGNTQAGFEELYGSTGTDRFFAVVPAQAGGWLLVGSTTSKGNGGSDGWLVRVDVTGKVLWEKTFGSSNDDVLYAGIEVPGGFLVVGQRYASGSQQVWVMKVESTGTQAYSKEYGSSCSDAAYAVTANDKGFLVAGKAGKSCSVSTTNAGWLAQFDGTGSMLWDQDVAGTTTLAGVAPTADGQIVVVGQGHGPTNSTDILVKKLKPGASSIWSTALGNSNGIDTPGALLAVADGSFVVSGQQAASGGDKPMMARVDATGGVMWSQTYTDVPGGILHGLVELGGAYVGVGSHYYNSQQDGYLVAVNKPNGAPQWTRKIAQNAVYNDGLEAGLATPGGLVVVGDGHVANASSNGWLLVVNQEGKLACDCDGGGCNDNNACTTDSCYLGQCKSVQVPTNTGCSFNGSPGYCDASGVCKASCGNGVCNSNETTSNCPSDCKAHPCNDSCGNKDNVYNCYCDSLCKQKGDCCNATGNVAWSCSGSTCGSCQ